MVTGTYVDPKAGKRTVEAYAEQQWLPSLVHVRGVARAHAVGGRRRSDRGEPALSGAAPPNRAARGRAARGVVPGRAARSDAAALRGHCAPRRLRRVCGSSASAPGLREGEALGLTAPRIDFLQRRIHVEEQIQGVNGVEPTLCPLKTRTSRRIVPVDDVRP